MSREIGVWRGFRRPATYVNDAVYYVPMSNPPRPVAQLPPNAMRLAKIHVKNQAPKASEIPATMKSICSALSSGYMGSDSTSAAARSLSDKSPVL